VPQVGDVALSPTGAKGHVAERRAAAPRSPRRLPRRRCAYVLLWDVAPAICTSFPESLLAVCASGGLYMHLRCPFNVLCDVVQVWEEN
jgi:hypothetical protein